MYTKICTSSTYIYIYTQSADWVVNWLLRKKKQPPKSGSSWLCMTVCREGGAPKGAQGKGGEGGESSVEFAIVWWRFAERKGNVMVFVILATRRHRCLFWKVGSLLKLLCEMTVWWFVGDFSCSILQHTTTQLPPCEYCSGLMVIFPAALQHTATNSNILQHTATHRNTQ